MNAPKKDHSPVRDGIFMAFIAQILYDPITFVSSWSTLIQSF